MRAGAKKEKKNPNIIAQGIHHEKGGHRDLEKFLAG
jgi:hypothetical protein